MSAPVVAAVAWIALAVVAVLGVLLAVVGRRLDALSREHTDRKWEIARLRAEMGALRRDVLPPGAPPAPELPESAAPQPTEADDGGRAARSWPASPTAWRRDRGRAPARPPRRRRPG